MKILLSNVVILKFFMWIILSSNNIANRATTKNGIDKLWDASNYNYGLESLWSYFVIYKKDTVKQKNNNWKHKLKRNQHCKCKTDIKIRDLKNLQSSHSINKIEKIESSFKD